MDGVNSSSSNINNSYGDGGKVSDVLIVGTTNRIHAIDAALLRPGRFEKHVLLEKPSVLDIESILNLFLSKAPLHDDVNLMDIAEVLFELGASGADIKGLCTEACLIAIRRIGERSIDQETDVMVTSVIDKDVEIDPKKNDDGSMFLRMTDFDEAIILWKK